MSKFVLIKCFYPEHYDAADHAVVEVTENLVFSLDKRLAQARAMWENDFFGTKWWDYTPNFIPCGCPESVGSDMSEDDFERALESNHFVRLADTFDVEQSEVARMSSIVLTVCASKGNQGVVGGFYWTGTDKYVGNIGRVETYEMHEDVVDEWAELAGCTEELAIVRKLRLTRFTVPDEKELRHEGHS